MSNSIIHTKKSYGIICFRKNENKQDEILMIKKSITYSFSEFVNGKYSKAPLYVEMMKLLNNMSYYEKIDILSLNFDIMWYRVYGDFYNNPFAARNKISNRQYNFYIKAKNKFEMTFLHDKGSYLYYLISKSDNSESVWEIPKGHKDENETDLEASIREFKEETNVDSSMYKIHCHIKPFIDNYIDNNINYRNTYYYATILDNTFVPKYKFTPSQLFELSDIKWINITNIKTQFHLSTNSHQLRINNALQLMIKKYKKYIKSI